MRMRVFIPEDGTCGDMYCRGGQASRIVEMSIAAGPTVVALCLCCFLSYRSKSWIVREFSKEEALALQVMES